MKLIRLFLASLLVGFALAVSFSAPVATVEAQSASQATPQNVKLLCVDSLSSAVFWPETNGRCYITKSIESVAPDNLPSNFKSICLSTFESSGRYAINDAVDTAGKTSCKKYEDDPKYSEVSLVPRAAISGDDPADQLDIIGELDVEPDPLVPDPKITPKITPKTTAGTGDCPDNFTSKGPLCIPENPFGESDGIAGKGTIGDLASTIISSLLMLAGIVAVIMIIYGGYIYMTARGSDEQAKSGRKTLTNAIIGLIIVIVSYAVVQAVTNYLTK